MQVADMTAAPLTWEEHCAISFAAAHPAPGAAKTMLAEHRSVVERARSALERCHLDPTERAWQPLVREIAKEIADAEVVMLKKTLAFMREVYGEPSR